jgi:hypothetical protein
MALEITPGGGFIATGNDVHKVRIVALKHRMRLEMRGLKFRGRSTYAILKSEFGLRGNKESVYLQFCDMHGLDR